MDNRNRDPLSALYLEDPEVMAFAARSKGTAVEFIESVRWAASYECVRCGSPDTYRVTGRVSASRNRRACRACKHQYTWKAGTALAGAQVDAQQILLAVAGLVEGVAPEVVAVNLERELGCSVRKGRLAVNKALELRLGAGDEPRSAESRGPVVLEREVVRWLPVAAIAATAATIVGVALFTPGARRVHELETAWTAAGKEVTHRTMAFDSESYWGLTRRHAREVAELKARIYRQE